MTEAGGQAAHLALSQAFPFFDRLLHTAEDQILQHFGIFRIDDFLGNFDRNDISEAVGNDGDFFTADTYFHGLFCERIIQLLLHLRSLLHHFLDVHRLGLRLDLPFE